MLLAILLGSVSPGLAQSPPSLQLERFGNTTRLTVSGQPGAHLTIQAMDNAIGVPPWIPLVESVADQGNFHWFDAQSALVSSRFYRAVQDSDPQPALPLPNFRLIDHTGRSRELEYSLSDPAVRSIVLLVTGTECPTLDLFLTSLEQLKARFAPDGVVFWMIDSTTPGSRSNLVSAAATKGITWPILHDRARLVAAELDARVTPEAWALERQAGGWTAFYRGPVDDRVGPLPGPQAQHYLSNALTAWLLGRPPTVIRARADGCEPTPTSSPTPDYATEIAPLLLEKCVTCHSPGNIAPWSMTNHAVVATYAPSIKDQILTGHMPPWHADPLHGTFANDFSLSPEAARRLVAWVNAGAPRGTGNDPLATFTGTPTNYPSAWPTSLGTPDAVLSIPQQSLPATGTLAYRYVTVTNPFPSNVWLRAAAVLPGNLRVVHHCLVLEGTTATGLDGFFAGYVPGYEAVPFPTNTGKLLRQGQLLRFQLHYTTTGQVETDRTQLGLYLAPSVPAFALQTKSAANAFTIPAGDPDYEAQGQFPLPPPFGTGTLQRDILLYEMSPHMHLRGRRFQYEAVRPDGSREILLSVPHYEFHWQTLYRLKEPKRITAGSRIICTAGWDNSPQNPDNPDPGATVGWGEQTDDEMFIGYLNFAEIP